MKIFLSALVVLLTSISLVSAQAVSIARIDYAEVDELVEAVVLSRPENKEIAERFKAQKAKEEALQKKMQEAIMNGEKVDLTAAATGMIPQSRDRKKIETLCEKHLLAVIEKTLGDEYDIILKSSYTSSLLYTRVAIDDVTDLIRQELLRQLPAK